jgi:mRNA-degrading endonuclease YafQ of YafQ-DinJ toxin-antitoxin module
MFQLIYTNRFKKDVKLLQKREFNLEPLKNAVTKLEIHGDLPTENKQHKL